MLVNGRGLLASSHWTCPGSGGRAARYTEADLNTPAALLPDPLASPEGGSGQDAALRANLKMKRGGPQPDGILAALLGPDPAQKSVDRAGDRK